MWIQQDSCPDYMLKAEDCLRAEEERVNNYLHQSSKTKLLEQARPSSFLPIVTLTHGSATCFARPYSDCKP